MREDHLGMEGGGCGEGGDRTALLECRCHTDKDGVSMIHGYAHCQAHCLAHCVANQLILLEGVNEEIVCSCLGSQGKLLGLIHVPLGSYPGEERCNVEIQEF